LAGKGTQEQSGRAILAQQQGGMLEAATILDRVRVLSLAVYRSVWCRVRQHWTAERWIRVTDNEQNLRFVGLNRPVTMLEAAAQQIGVTQENFQQMAQAKPEEMQQLAMLAQSPQAQQIVKVDNAVAELDVDILVDEGIDTPTIAAEQFDQMLKMVGTGMVQIPPDVLIEASSLRNKDKLLEMMKKGPSPEEQQMQQTMQQLLVRKEAATVGKLEADTALSNAKAVNEAQAVQEGNDPQAEAALEIQKANIKAQTDIEVARIKAMTQAAMASAKDELNAMTTVHQQTEQARTERESQALEAANAKADAVQEQIKALAEVVTHLGKPRIKTPIRDASGMIVSIREEAA
jgi:hypothetical protein